MRKRRYIWLILCFSFFSCGQTQTTDYKPNGDSQISDVAKDANFYLDVPIEIVIFDTQVKNSDTISDTPEIVDSKKDVAADNLFEVVDIIAPTDIKKEVIQLGYLDECPNGDECEPIYADASYCVKSENPEITGYKSLCTVPCIIKNGEETITLPVYGDANYSCSEVMKNGAVCCGLVENSADSNFHNYCIPSQHCCYNGIICGKECCKENITKCAKNGMACIADDEVECNDGNICKKDLCTPCGCLQEGESCCDDGSMCFDGDLCSGCGCLKDGESCCDDGSMCFDNKDCSECGCLDDGEFCCNGKICNKDQCLECGCLEYGETCCNSNICKDGTHCSNCGCILDGKICCDDGSVCKKCSDCGCLESAETCCNGMEICELGFKCTSCGCILNEKDCCSTGEICKDGFKCSDCGCIPDDLICCEDGNICENCSDCGCLGGGEICCNGTVICKNGAKCSDCGCLKSGETCCNGTEICGPEYYECTDCGCVDVGFINSKKVYIEICCQDGSICTNDVDFDGVLNEKCSNCGCISEDTNCCPDGNVCKICSNCGCLEEGEICCADGNVCLNEGWDCTNCGCLDTDAGEICCPNGTVCWGEVFCAEVGNEQCIENGSVKCSDHYCPEDNNCLNGGDLCCPVGQKICGKDNNVCCVTGEICNENKKLCVPEPQCDDQKPVKCKYTCCAKNEKCSETEDECVPKCAPPAPLYCFNECCANNFTCECENQGGFCLPLDAQMCDCDLKKWCVPTEECIESPICRLEGKFCKPLGGTDCPEAETCYCDPADVCTGKEPACCPSDKPKPCGEYCCEDGSECIPEIKACLKQDEEYCGKINPECQIICSKDQKCMTQKCGCINDWEQECDDGTICANTQKCVGDGKGIDNSGCCPAAQPVACDGYCCNEGYHCDASCGGCVEDGYKCCPDGKTVCFKDKICYSGGGKCLDSPKQDCGKFSCVAGKECCADGCMPEGYVCCGKMGGPASGYNCEPGKKCCGSDYTNLSCAAPGKSCCAATSTKPYSWGCNTGQVCCGDGCMTEGLVCCGKLGNPNSNYHWCGTGKKCCGTDYTNLTCAAPGKSCCPATSTKPYPWGCGTGATCCGDGCMTEGLVCCGKLGGPATGYACDSGKTCCGTDYTNYTCAAPGNGCCAATSTKPYSWGCGTNDVCCGDGCMPEEGVCCGKLGDPKYNYHWCDPNKTCCGTDYTNLTCAAVGNGCCASTSTKPYPWGCGAEYPKCCGDSCIKEGNVCCGSYGIPGKGFNCSSINVCATWPDGYHGCCSKEYPNPCVSGGVNKCCK